MKKLMCIAIAALFSTAILAQQKPVWGLKAGVNLATLNAENVDDDAIDTRVGFHIGALGHIHLSHKIAFQPELQYSTQGAENNDGDKFKTSYLNVPLMLQYMFNNGFRLEAGPQVGFLLQAEDEDSQGNEFDSDDDYEKVDFGLGFGLNYLTYSGLGVGARYNLGLSNINKVGTTDINNRVFQISLFYMFDNDHKAKSR